jgi:myo-inositol 2-dehydrogenase/D-chiro-inositol 1-dehydrogenase
MAISNSAVHEIDISRWLLGEEFSTIQVFQPATSAPDATVSPVFLVIRTEKGKLISIENNNNGGYGYDVQGELACEKGSIALATPIDTSVNLELTRRTDFAPDWRQRFRAAYARQLQAWVDAIAAETVTGASAWDGYAASAVGEAGLVSLAEGRAARVELRPRPVLYAA